LSLFTVTVYYLYKPVGTINNSTKGNYNLKQESLANAGKHATAVCV